METKDILEIAAVLLSPLIAIQAEKFIERARSKKNRKIQIFKTLMATRGSKLSNDHVTALNQIDLEFEKNRKYQKTLNAWKEYLDQLCVNVDSTKEDEYKPWNEKAEDLLANLLFEMGIPLGYNFDKVIIKRNAYSPIGHVKADNENQKIRQLLIKVLNGENYIITQQVSPKDIAESNNEVVNNQLELQTLMIDYYKNAKPVKVKIIKE